MENDLFQNIYFKDEKLEADRRVRHVQTVSIRSGDAGFVGFVRRVRCRRPRGLKEAPARSFRTEPAVFSYAALVQ